MLAIIKFNDFSYLLTSKYFAHENDRTEHLAYSGRKKLAKSILEAIVD